MSVSVAIDLSLPVLQGEQERRLRDLLTDIWFPDGCPWKRLGTRRQVLRHEDDLGGRDCWGIARDLLLAVFCADLSLGFSAQVRVVHVDYRLANDLFTFRDLPPNNRLLPACQGCDDPLCEVPDGVPLTRALLLQAMRFAQERGSKACAATAASLLQRQLAQSDVHSLIPEIAARYRARLGRLQTIQPGTPGRDALEEEVSLLREWLELTRRIPRDLAQLHGGSAQSLEDPLRTLAAHTWTVVQAYRHPRWHSKPDTSASPARRAAQAARTGLAAQLYRVDDLVRECMRSFALAPLPCYRERLTDAISLQAWAAAHLHAWVDARRDAVTADVALGFIVLHWRSSWEEYGLEVPGGQDAPSTDFLLRLAGTSVLSFDATLRSLVGLAPLERLRDDSLAETPLGPLPS